MSGLKPKLKKVVLGLKPLIGVSLIFSLMVGSAVAEDVAVNSMDGSIILSTMQKAVKNNNFELYLTKGNAGQLEPMQFSHGIIDGHDYTRWLYLDNASSGYYTKDDTVVYFDKGEERMSVGNGRLPGSLPRIMFVNAERIVNSYQPIILGEIRAAGHTAIGLRLMPRWNDRYSYVIAIDKKSFLPLSAQVISPGKGMVESYAGVYLKQGDEASDDLKSMAKKLGEKDISNVNAPVSNVNLGWKVSYVPEGFSQILSAHYPLGNYGSEVEHMLYSDGLADFSVYRLKTLESIDYPIVRQGGTNLFRHRMQDYEIIVVGDLPFDIEKKIAESYVKQ